MKKATPISSSVKIVSGIGMSLQQKQALLKKLQSWKAKPKAPKCTMCGQRHKGLYCPTWVK